MQIEIYNPEDGQALPPVKWNYDELKQQLTEGLAAYKGRVYTDDTITQAKKDRAALNKLATAIDDKRKDMQPAQDLGAAQGHRGQPGQRIRPRPPAGAGGG